MEKILIVSTVSRQFYLFEEGNIEVLKSLGYEVHGAANFKDKNPRMDSLDIQQHHLSIERSPFALANILALYQLVKLMKKENFDLVHCHSPMGGVLARLAALLTKHPKVIYTAHGFHFYDGAPLKNWLLYFPIEKLLSRFTDILITINKEDYRRALKFNSKKIIYIPGIGINIEKFNKKDLNKAEKLNDLGIKSNQKVFLTIGELIERKNYETAIKSLAYLKDQNFIYLICGTGVLEDSLKTLVKNMGFENKVFFLGYRNDISEICSIADIFIFPSYQEGLPVSIMEAMAAGLPVVCSEIRGNTDLIENEINGLTFEPSDYIDLAKKIDFISENKRLRKEMKVNNEFKVVEYSKKNIQKKMKKVYMNIIEGRKL